MLYSRTVCLGETHSSVNSSGKWARLSMVCTSKATICNLNHDEISPEIAILFKPNRSLILQDLWDYHWAQWHNNSL